MRQLKATLRSREEERKRASETLCKIRASEAKAIKEKDQFSQTVATLDKEKEEEATAATKKIHELELKIEHLPRPTKPRSLKPKRLSMRLVTRTG